MFKHGGVLSIDSPSHGDVFCAIRTCWPSSDAIHPVEMESALVNQCARTRNRSVYKSNEFKVSTKVNVFGTQLVTQWPVSASVMKLCRALAIAYACSLATYAVVCVPFWTSAANTLVGGGMSVPLLQAFFLPLLVLSSKALQCLVLIDKQWPQQRSLFYWSSS